MQKKVKDALPGRIDGDYIDYINMVEAHNYDLSQVENKIALMRESEPERIEYFNKLQKLLQEHRNRISYC